ncbi:hypothetical protein VTI74DRAFT_6300 [Chaetomium olivicolor]
MTTLHPITRDLKSASWAISTRLESYPSDLILKGADLSPTASDLFQHSAQNHRNTFISGASEHLLDPSGTSSILADMVHEVWHRDSQKHSFRVNLHSIESGTSVIFSFQRRTPANYRTISNRPALLATSLARVLWGPAVAQGTMLMLRSTPESLKLSLNTASALATPTLRLDPLYLA